MNTAAELIKLAKEWEERQREDCSCASSAKDACASDLRRFAQSICQHDFKVGQDELGTLHKKCAICGERRDAK
jgi:hypothetical protein